uniref:Uncharacterized protein n=1 Tax=Romanomermis culicivorax TaxID=13658 RepID=A0A915INT9_ROMCU
MDDGDDFSVDLPLITTEKLTPIENWTATRTEKLSLTPTENLTPAEKLTSTPTETPTANYIPLKNR